MHASQNAVRLMRSFYDYDYEALATTRARLQRLQRKLLDDYIVGLELDPWNGAAGLIDEVR